MKHTTSLCLIATLALSLSAQVVGAAPPKKGGKDAPKKIYCWEEKGVRVCGDALPASAINEARTEINSKTGLATKQVDRVLTEEEKLAKQQAEAAAAAAAQQQQQLRQQEQQLVMGYADEAAFNRAYDDKEAAVKATMAETQKAIDNIRTVLVTKLDLAGEMELNKKPVPAASAQSIQQLHGQVRAQEAQLSRQAQNLEQVKQERAQNLVIFRAAMQQRLNPGAATAEATPPAPGTPSAAPVAPATPPAK